MRSKVVIDFETTYNTDPVSKAGKVLNFIKASMSAKQNLTTPGSNTGTRNPVAPQRGFVDVGGDIVSAVDLIGSGYVLKALFGAPTTTGTTDYTHVFKPGLTQPSMVIEQQFPDISVYNKYNGCKASKYSMSVGGDGEFTHSLSFMGAKETVGAAVYDATATTALVLTPFSNPQITLEEGGSAFALGKSLDLSIDMGLDGDTYVIGGGGFRGALNEGIIAITGTLTALFTDNVLLNKAVNGTESSLKIVCTIAATKAMEILIPEIIYERNSPGIETPKGILISLPFRGYYQDNANATSIMATLKNQTASYA